MEANILRILVILVGVALVAVIMVQQPKEGGMGAFTGGGGGSGASSTVFGAKGSGSFLFRLTAGLVLAFVILIVSLVKVTNSDLGGSVLSTPVAEESIPPAAEKVDPSNSIPSASESTANNAVNAVPANSAETSVPASTTPAPADENSIPSAN